MNPKLKMFLKILLVIFLLLCVVGAGIVAAMFFGLFGDEFEISKEELIVGTSNTIVVDKDGKEIVRRKKFDRILQGGFLLTGILIRWCYLIFFYLPGLK